MKRFIIAVFALLISCSAVSAQQKGDIYFGGMAGVTIQAVSSNGGSTSAGFLIQPEFGAFVADKCKLGISVGYALSGGIHTFTAAPNFSYYVRLCEGLYYTPTIEAGFVMVASGGKSAGIGVGAQLYSMEFRPTKRFGFTTNLASINFVAMSTAAFNFDLGVNPTVGVRYYF